MTSANATGHPTPKRSQSAGRRFASRSHSVSMSYIFKNIFKTCSDGLRGDRTCEESLLFGLDMGLCGCGILVVGLNPLRKVLASRLRPNFRHKAFVIKVQQFLVLPKDSPCQTCLQSDTFPPKTRAIISGGRNGKRDTAFLGLD